MEVKQLFAVLLLLELTCLTIAADPLKKSAWSSEEDNELWDSFEKDLASSNANVKVQYDSDETDFKNAFQAASAKADPVLQHVVSRKLQHDSDAQDLRLWSTASQSKDDSAAEAAAAFNTAPAPSTQQLEQLLRKLDTLTEKYNELEAQLNLKDSDIKAATGTAHKVVVAVDSDEDTGLFEDDGTAQASSSKASASPTTSTGDDQMDDTEKADSDPSTKTASSYLLLNQLINGERKTLKILSHPLSASDEVELGILIKILQVIEADYSIEILILN